MVNSPNASYYQQRANQFQQESQTIEKQIRVLAWLRVACVVVLGIIVYMALSNTDFYYAVPLPLIAFILLVRKQTAAREWK
ncbi:MAG TPA: hypothetical protein PKM03_03725, partial [Cyclobacteriaceae bacterium]|nr:hypothetical protein [Cyclobacteriaceae bacterium]